MQAALKNSNAALGFNPIGGPQGLTTQDPIAPPAIGAPQAYSPTPFQMQQPMGLGPYGGGGWQNFNNPFNVQSFARGGVVSWSDPYGQEPLAAQEYVRSVPLADVSGIAGAIMRQNQAKQEMYQQNVQNAFNAANKIMQQRQTDEIGKALITNNPEISQDPRTIAMINAGAHPLDVYKAVSQQQADEADAKRQATNDYYTQQAHQAAINKTMGLDVYGQPLPRNTVLSGGKEWLQDENGNWHQVTGNAALKYQEAKNAPNPYEDRYKMFTTPDVVKYYNADKSQKLSSQEAENDTNAVAVLPDGTTMPLADYKKMAGQVVNKYYANKAPTDNPSDNQTGTAPPVTAPKQLDAATAKQFLDQAGGDKNKARQLAAAAGYTF